LGMSVETGLRADAFIESGLLRCRQLEAYLSHAYTSSDFVKAFEVLKVLGN